MSTSDKDHKQELITLLKDIMSEIDLKPLHPKNKILLYSRFLLSKFSWHFTVATLSKTWVCENMDSVVNKFVRKWLDIPVSGTLSNVFLTPSVKFTQCQTVSRKALWKSTCDNTNIQFDVYTSTKEVLKSFKSAQEDKLQNHLLSPRLLFHERRQVLVYTKQPMVQISIKLAKKHL